jgi:predicted RND superfamily exporter protein
MNKPPYGKKNKKIVFYDSDKRYADLKIRLMHDKISQAQFFRCIVTGYIEQDEDVLNFIDKLKQRTQTKKSIKENRKLITKGKELISDLSLDESEKNSIFDLIENESPDL